MDAAVIETKTFNPLNTSVENAAAEETVPVLPAPDANDLAFEIGLWLSGLESFLNVRSHSLAEENRAKAASRDWAKEFRLTHSTLLLCSRMTFQLGKSLKDKEDSLDEIDLDFEVESFAQQSLEIAKAFDKLVETAEKQGEQFLPEVLLNLLESKPLPLALESDLRLILPRFGKILKWLSVIDRMLKQDQPPPA